LNRRPKRIGDAGRGFTLAEVLVALSLVASAGVAATGTGLALTALTARARAEVVALELAGAKIEELSAKPSEERGNGFDEIEEDAVRVTRMWRVWTGDPEPGLKRLEVTARWRDPQLNILTLVAVSP
jgi:prepilin-type N-terminal cleavage/methylation domain-containing protein